MQLMAPGLVTGAAPPANGPPARSPSGSTGGAPGQPSPFEQLLTAVRAVLQGGETETARPPDGGAPTSLEPLPTPADLLAALTALTQGATPDGASGDAKTDLSLLDRLTEAGEELIDDSEFAPGAAEALMSFLVTGGVLIPHAETPPTALPSLDVDVRDALVALEMAARAAANAADVASAQAAATAATGGDAGIEVASQPLVAPALQAAVEDVLKDAGVTVETEPATTTATMDTAPDAPGGTLSLPTIEASSTPAAGSTAASEAGPSAETVREMQSSPVSDTPTDGGTHIETPAPAAEATAARLESSGTDSAAAVNAGAAGGVAAPSVSAQPQTVTAPVRTDAATLPNVVTEVVQAAVLRGDSEVRLVLNPPELGHLDIRIVTHEGGLRVSMEASQSGARDLIERALPGLQQGLEARDLRVDRLEVRATDTGRGSLDSSGTGQQPAGQDGQPEGRDGRPEWSAVASFGMGASGESGLVEPSQQTAGDGRLDVMA